MTTACCHCQCTPGKEPGHLSRETYQSYHTHVAVNANLICLDVTVPRLLVATLDQQQAELRQAGMVWYESLPVQAEHPAKICLLNADPRRSIGRLYCAFTTFD